MAISPHTVPGTAVVWNGRLGVGSKSGRPIDTLLSRTQVYHVRRIVIVWNEPAAVLTEIDARIAFDLSFIDYAALPKCLTELLDKVPLKPELVS